MLEVNYYILCNHFLFFLVTRAPYFPSYQDNDGPRINIDKSSDEHNQEKNSGHTTAISGCIGGAVCLVALIAAVAVKQKRDSDRKEMIVYR